MQYFINFSLYTHNSNDMNFLMSFYRNAFVTCVTNISILKKRLLCSKISHFQHYDVPACDQLSVKSDYVIGIQYPKGSANGVIPYEQSKKKSTSGTR